MNTPFSIFLSGILVKIALYGMYKFIFLGIHLNNVFFIFIALVSIIDITIKLFSQVDYKKIIAYCTVFEMNFMIINLFFLAYSTCIYILYFCILHTTFSCLFFLVNDFLYKRYNTRCITNIFGLYTNITVLPTLLIICIILFSGLPFTLKFNIEFFLLIRLLNYDCFVYFILMFIQFLFIIYFFKLNYSLLFNNTHSTAILDLSIYEIFPLIYNILVLLVF